jgi:prolyl 4-hydroxylase
VSAAVPHAAAALRDVSIFVSIVCEAGPRLPRLLREGWERADAPEQLWFGVVRTSGDHLPELDASPVPAHRLRLVDVPRAAAGPSGRLASLGMGLYGGETWILQLEPGAVFQPHWDAALLKAAAALQAAGGNFVIARPLGLERGAGFDAGHFTLPFEERVLDGDKALRGLHLSQRCIFAPGHFADQFPADPWLDAAEADQALSARLFTHGWDVQYVPGHPIAPPAAQHPGAGAPPPPEAQRSRQRLAQLLGGAADLGAYGLGRARSLQEFALRSGVDYPNRRIGAHAHRDPSPHAASLPAGPGGQALDDSWKSWLAGNLQRGCRPDELLGILLNHQFSLASIREGMGDRFPATSALLKKVQTAGELGPDYGAIAQPPLLRRRDGNLRRVDTGKLQLFTLDDCLSGSECDALVDVVNQHLRPSTITVESTDKYFRTSRSCDLSGLNPLVAMVDEKIARALGIRREWAEPNQAQRYDVGQEFKAHTDYFDPGTDEFATFGGDRGNRTWTFMVYLNEGMQGGGTRFLAIEKTFQPKKGQAVIWNNLYPDGTPNPDTLHSGMPVIEGHKVIVTMWFRALGGYGPMFFEDQ